VTILATSKSSSEVVAPTPLLGKPAPEISGPALDGTNESLSSLRGKWVLVNFSASWCVPCQEEQPALVAFQQHHLAEGDTTIFGVRYDDPDPGPIRSLMQRTGGHWNIVDDPTAIVAWSVTGPPESFLLDPNGYVLTHIVGRIDTVALDGLLARARAGEPAAESGAGRTAVPGAAGGSGDIGGSAGSAGSGATARSVGTVGSGTTAGSGGPGGSSPSPSP
jgi:cytochrome c biogenesis protein CcmG/thiol:disulfide interchange protein DsbE